MVTDIAAAVVFVIDDDAEVRRSLARLMRAEGLRCEAFSCARAFLERLPYDGVGCVMLDIKMPGMPGPELQDQLLSSDISLPIIYLTGNGDVPNSVHAMKHGAVDFLLKPAEDTLILNTIRAALVKHAAIKARELEQQRILALLSRLSRREREVLEFVIGGRLNKQIASDLGITEKTVKVHRAHMMEKLELRSVAKLVRMCVSAGIEPRLREFMFSRQPEIPGACQST